MGPGWTVAVRAVVLHEAETGNIRYVQAGFAILNLYAKPTNILIFCDLQNGDSIQFRGQRKAYNGLLEMAPTLRFIRWPAAGGRRRHIRCACQWTGLPRLLPGRMKAAWMQA